LREILHIQTGQCGTQMGTKYWELVCEERRVGFDCEYCGGNDAQLGRISVFYHEASAESTHPARCFLPRA
jgi:tubulin beta